jgi:hypothetical protein
MGNRSKSDIQGEGNYRAARRYRDSAEEFVESGRVKRAARKAGQVSEQERREMERAEQRGRSRAKGQEPGRNDH